MGHPRANYGLSTATDFFTGSLRPKTWFLKIWTKSVLQRIAGDIPWSYSESWRRRRGAFNFLKNLLEAKVVSIQVALSNDDCHTST